MQTERVPVDGAGLLIGAPHTSNWDFILMLAISGEADLKIRWLGKHQLFRGLAGPLMRGLGGIPVDRRDPAGLVDEIVARIQGGDRFYLVVTPEGTRSGRAGSRASTGSPARRTCRSLSATSTGRR